MGNGAVRQSSALRWHDEGMVEAGELAAWLDRIERENADLHALVPEPGRGERLRAAVRDLARPHPEGGRRPLSGVLAGVKDILHVDGLPTGAGSQVPPEVLAGPQAGAVTRLRDAGALILGKTETAEFASFHPAPTRNPRNRDHTPGGSSSGSAAAVAAGWCPLALGTQTIGSVIRPAAYCGVVGFKPSFGRIPTDGVIANAPSFDTIGTFSADVAAAGSAAAVLCDGWHRVEAPGRPALGIPDGPYLDQAEPEALAAFEDRVQALESAGFSIVRMGIWNGSGRVGHIADVNARHRLINTVELARVHARLFDSYAERYSASLARTIRQGREIPAAEYASAREAHAAFRGALTAVMDREGIDAWIAPAATGPAPPGLASTGDPAMALPWTHAGFPAVTLPAGTATNGLPLGLQCVARFGADERLLAWVDLLASTGL